MLWTHVPENLADGGSTIGAVAPRLVVRVRTLVGVCLSGGGFVHCGYYNRVKHMQQPTA